MLSALLNARTVSKLQFMNPGIGFRSVQKRLSETAAASWRLSSLVVDCSSLKLLPLETPGQSVGRSPMVECLVDGTCSDHDISALAAASDSILVVDAVGG